MSCILLILQVYLSIDSAIKFVDFQAMAFVEYNDECNPKGRFGAGEAYRR